MGKPKSQRTSCEGSEEIAEKNNIEEDHLEKSRGGTEDNNLVSEEKEKHLDAFALDHHVK